MINNPHEHIGAKRVSSKGHRLHENRKDEVAARIDNRINATRKAVLLLSSGEWIRRGRLQMIADENNVSINILITDSKAAQDGNYYCIPKEETTDTPKEQIKIKEKKLKKIQEEREAAVTKRQEKAIYEFGSLTGMFCTAVEKIRESRKINRKDFFSEIGVGYHTFYNLQNQKGTWTNNLEKIAEAMGYRIILTLERLK